MMIRRFIVSPIKSNCYVLSESEERGAKAVVIDPGDPELNPVFDYIERVGLTVIGNWNTHGHFDHVLGVDTVRTRFGVSSNLHQADLLQWQTAGQRMEQILGKAMQSPRDPDAYLRHGDVLALGDLRFTVWHTPGHSAGSVCFVGEGIAVTGDTLFAGAIGRTDLPESSPADMRQSLKQILTWDDSLVLYPGHGDSTTMEEERVSNGFLLALQRV